MGAGGGGVCLAGRGRGAGGRMQPCKLHSYISRDPGFPSLVSSLFPKATF